VTTDTTATVTGLVDPPRRGRVKCVVWDLDDTLWDGILLEDPDVALRPWVRSTLATLDERGVLHSIASRNDPATALRKLDEFGLTDYFLHPQIGWNPKSRSVADIAELLNIGVDALAFVDDQPFELDEVAFANPTVLCVDAAAAAGIVDRPEFMPRFVTAESRQRRSMYRGGIERERAQRAFTGGDEAFLRTLDMAFTISRAGADDLQRAEELTVRTNQLNSTGTTYSYADLEALSVSPDHLLLVAGLTDRYGSYGTIGLALVERGAKVWTLKLLLMSCRVMSRGVGTVLLNHVMRLAGEQGVRLEAEFVPTDRNRIMYVTYRFAGFTETGTRAGVVVLTAPRGGVPDPPSYLSVTYR
jgi:FkbH-like protein